MAFALADLHNRQSSRGVLAFIAKIFLFCSVTLPFIGGDAIVQRRDNCGRLTGIPNDNDIHLTEQPTFIVSSHLYKSGFKGYDPARTCLVTVRGRQSYQWTITINTLDLSGKIDPSTKLPIECYDALKIYDSPRADNAYILTPLTGYCGVAGRDLQVTAVMSCQNYITFEFIADNVQESGGGFEISMVQTPWRNRGSRFSGTMIVNAADNCMPREYQVNWRYQELAKGSQVVNYDIKETYKYGTFWCYECSYCNVDYFEPKQYPSAAKAGCYICLKQHDLAQGYAKRVCLTERDYTFFMGEVIQEGSDTIKDTRKYTGCFEHTNRFNKVLRFCFCEGDYCNSAFTLSYNISLILLSVILWFLH